MLCDCPWRVRFKKQLNDSWIVTELIDEHQGHQLEGVDPLSYSVNRPVTAEARATMFELVRDSSTTLNTVASMLNKTYGLSLLPRDAYNRTYDHGQKWLLDQDGYLYRVRLGPENTLDGMFFCKIGDVRKARVYGQANAMDATYKRDFVFHWSTLLQWIT
ncbi:hypothetical protein POJ06DRAFT_294687 [Lipomyces tetrasporus]|uniref:Uncharacterized protein n=1 Tax=Lipomyces tetrasporus TaxID=54092 RepID=A0AAD7VVD5_9ASCO|nr:uncharacterized protein POJ06DRAFT_294687 [Lipomyces tetrasporus]KAJ8102100.1 hypothetical protein POJ06DRAFT_294687 [Lipomyces tetrasporus]